MALEVEAAAARADCDAAHVRAEQVRVCRGGGRACMWACVHKLAAEWGLFEPGAGCEGCYTLHAKRHARQGA